MHVVFDYHQECRGGNQANLQKVKAKLEQLMQDFSFFYSNGTTVYRYKKSSNYLVFDGSFCMFSISVCKQEPFEQIA